jgi:two-component system, OmpR family, phosphate regulon sensor histidine kinase PhoR
MSTASLNRLGDLIIDQSSALLAQWRKQIKQLPAARHMDRPTIDDHIPELLEELATALQTQNEASIAEAMLEGTPPAHGLHRLAEGFDIAEVVAEYNILRGCIHDLAERNGVEIRGSTFHILNRVLDEAIGLAVQTYATQRAIEVQKRREEYLSFVAHDLRTPLNAVALSANVLQMLLGNQSENAQVGRLWTTLHRNVQHLEKLVEQVMQENTASSDEAAGRMERRFIDLWPIVETVFEDLKVIADTNGTQLANQVPVDLLVYADAGMLTRVLQNLLANAIRYTPRGEVAVGAKSKSEDGAFEGWITDHGASIPAEALEQAFGKNGSEAKPDDGIALGLAIVKDFLDAHGGTLRLESNPDSKTLFRFTLPGKNA